MPVLPALQAVLDAVNANPMEPNDDLSVAELRDIAHASMAQSFGLLGEAGPDPASTTDHRVPVEGGEITVRVYRPHGDGPFPVHVYFHGGGFWLGDLDMSDGYCRSLVAEAGCAVASVDYRLAPEHRWPTAADDCFAATVWVVEHAAELGVDAARLSVGGASAGGNLAAVVSLMARDRGGPAIQLQVLDIPVTDLTMSSATIGENGEGYLLTKRSMEQYTAYYLGPDGDPTHPYASPLLAPDLSGLPPAVVITAEFDPLRGEGEAYADRLDEAGVRVVHKRFDGHFHGSLSMAQLCRDDWAAALDLVVRELS